MATPLKVNVTFSFWSSFVLILRESFVCIIVFFFARLYSNLCWSVVATNRNVRFADLLILLTCCCHRQCKWLTFMESGLTFHYSSSHAFHISSLTVINLLVSKNHETKRRIKEVLFKWTLIISHICVFCSYEKNWSRITRIYIMKTALHFIFFP